MGKAMDATVRDMQAVGAWGVKMSFPDLATDKLTYNITLDTLDGAGAIVPENGQTVTLYRNGVKFFFGPCKVRQSGYTITVEVMGGWYWFELLNLTSLQTDSIGNSAERIQFAFPTQSSEISITALLNRMITLGAPISIGTLATGFTWPEVTLNQSNGDIALAELIRLTPDMSSWWDYSGLTPSFNTARRSTATVRTMDARDLGENFTIEPVTQLKAEFVRVPFVDRAVDGRRIFREQLSGDAGTAQSGSTSTTIKLRAGASFSDEAYKNLSISIISGTGSGQVKTITGYVGSTRVATVNSAWTTTPNNTSVYKIGEGLPVGIGTTAILTVSGEDLDTFLPDELFDTVTLQTVNPNTPGAVGSTYVLNADGFFRGLMETYGAALNPGATGGSSPGLFGGTLTTYEGFASNKTPKYRYVPPLEFKADAPAPPLGSLAGKYMVVLGETPEWLKPDGITVWEATLGGYVIASALGPNNSASVQPAAWFATMMSQSDQFRGWLSSAPGDTTWVDYAIKRVDVSVKLISASYPTSTVVYKKADYGFRFPPVGFAANLQAAQSFTPYTGAFSVDEQESGGTRYRGCVVNLTNARAEFATMKAIVSGEDIDIDNGITTVTLGAPARLDYRSLVDKVRRTSQDNIVYLLPAP